MNRREMLVGSAALAAGTFLGKAAEARAQERKPFKLRYAFDAGQFRHHAPGGVLDEIKFAADQGFTAMEDNGMKGRPPEMQEKIGAELAKHNMTMGIFVMNGKTGFKGGGSLTTGKPEDRDAFLAEVRESIDVAKRCGAKWMTSLVGNADPRLARGYQFANVVDCLRRAAEILEPHGLVMVFEPLNVLENHPGFFISQNHEMYALMKAVRSPSCKMLFDLYHTQISEGRLIRNFDQCFDEIAYIQTGDTPGRKEPGTGEVNYRNVFRHIYQKGYKGLIGMEHGKSLDGKEGELALIQAYRDADNF
ncbi:MAG: hydroxypyruvate isomerase family protein [Planctomycetota bacterium]